MVANNVANNFITKVLANASQQLLRPFPSKKFFYLLELNFAFLSQNITFGATSRIFVDTVLNEKLPLGVSFGCTNI